MAKKVKKKEYIYLSWNYTSHGTAYLKHILSAFYSATISADSSQRIEKKGISQEEMQTVFDCEIKGGFVFDKVYMLAFSDEITDQISSRQRGLGTRINTMEQDEEFKSTGTGEIWADMFIKDLPLEQERAYLQQNYGEKWPILDKQYWRNIQHYNLSDQISWLEKYSNPMFKELYVDSKRFEPKELKKVKDSRDSREIATYVLEFIKELKKKHPEGYFIINVSLGSYEAQNVWYVLGEADLLPNNTRFISTYDPKTNNSLRFKPINIIERDTKLVSSIYQHLDIYQETTSLIRRLAYSKMKVYVEQGFSILILGERGTGKSHLVETIHNEKKNAGKNFPFAAANCASFDDDSKAEADLFGYEVGAFTGANKRADGLFHQAKNGILFFDEVHHLSLRVQAKLMKSLQTNQNNEFQIRRLGSNKEETIKCTLVFASNREVSELKKLLLPDLFDRISQLVIEFPPLRKTREDLKNDWNLIWQQLRFDEKGKEPAPKDDKLFTWIKNLPLYGNYRDLQKIAIYYHTFLKFDEAIRKDLPVQTPLEFAQQEFSLYQSDKQTNKGDIFSDYFEQRKSWEDIKEDFRVKLVQEAFKFYGDSVKDIAEVLGISQQTIYNIKNKS